MLFCNLVPGKFPKAEQSAVVRNRVESHAPAKFLKEGIVGMRERLSEIQILARGNANHGVARNYTFLQSRDRNHRLNRRAWNEAGGKCQLLIDDRKQPPCGGIDSDNGAVVTAQRLDRRLADDWIVVCNYIVLRRVSKSGDAKARDTTAPDRRMRVSRDASSARMRRRCWNRKISNNKSAE